jgi:cytochrome c-type biogenesis protein CcmF
MESEPGVLKRIWRFLTRPLAKYSVLTLGQVGIIAGIVFWLGEPLDDGAAWIVRVYFKPFVSWIWGGCLLLALGAALAASDRRYRARRTSE